MIETSFSSITTGFLEEEKTQINTHIEEVVSLNSTN
jgi:hypothetical protein